MQLITPTKSDGNIVATPVDKLAKGVYFLQIVHADGKNKAFANCFGFLTTNGFYSRRMNYLMTSDEKN